MHRRQEDAIDRTSTAIDTIFMTEDIPMRHRHIKTRLKKIFKMYENQSRNFKKEKAAIYLSALREKMQEPFYNPRNPTQEQENVTGLEQVEGLENLEVQESEQVGEEIMEEEFLEEEFVLEERVEEFVEEEAVVMQEEEIVEKFVREEEGEAESVDDEIWENEDLEGDEEDDHDMEWLPSDSETELVPDEASCFVANAIKSPEVTKACLATNTSPNELMLITSAMNHANKVSNKGNAESTIYGYQKKHQAELATKRRNETTALFTGQSVFLHFDEKSMKNTTQGVDEMNHIERCAIVASSSVGIRLLAVKKLVAGTGENIANALNETAVEYAILQFIIGLVFDTTLANTGISNGSAAIFERVLGRFLLFLGCRHHIYEIYLKTCFETLFGASGRLFHYISP